ncbi:MAG TPA: hypothetical protein PL182_10885 [Pseudobdellovibrionaceae bacterium]|nr:hypothetical protein [Pseudobdellovibrionaceae bacterium]
MKSLSVLLLSLAIGTSSSALANEVLSMKDWTSRLDAALKAGKASEISRQLDLGRIESNVLAVRNVKERQLMIRARSAYKAGKLDEAIKLYNQVPKGSDSWLEAVEEKGWAYLLKNDTEKALAQTKTLLAPTFLPVVGSEPFLLQTLSQLKICDYKEILETNKSFKESQRARLVAVQDLADKGTSDSLAKAISKVDQFPIAFAEIGEESKTLPRLFHRDREAQKLILRMKMAEAGVPVLKQALANGTKFRSLASKSIARLEANAASARKALPARMKNLAQAEVNDSFRVIQKLNLIEVETIQRVHTDQQLDQDSYSKGKFAVAGADQLVFPDDGHPWIDELDKYQVQVNACPSNVRRKM